MAFLTGAAQTYQAAIVTFQAAQQAAIAAVRAERTAAGFTQASDNFVAGPIEAEMNVLFAIPFQPITVPTDASSNVDQ